ncbi:MAG TPA: DUF6754 domain-containing protein [Anaerolineaceae bacterium]
MNWLEPILGFVLVLLAASLMFVFALPNPAKKRSATPGAAARFALRPIPAMQRLRRAIGLAVEDGSRLHVSIGKSSIISPYNGSALVGLSTLERIGMLSSVSDRPPVTTSGDGTLALLSRDTLRAAYRISNVPELYDPIQARLAGPTPFSFAVGTLPVIHDERVSANILVGNFGPEIALMLDAANREGSFTLAASDAFAAQAVLYAAASAPLIGEELFAVPAYLQAGPIHQAGLRVQDILRWLVIVALVVGAVLAFLGIL